LESLFTELVFHSILSCILFTKKISDKKEMELFKKIIKPGDVILDIGANIGL